MRAEMEHARREAERASELKAKLEASTPNADVYQIEEVQRVGKHLVLKVRYPNCAKCSYEGLKVMVFLNVTEAEVLCWKRIDPHFRNAASGKQRTEAPGPAARFPGSKEGWADAIIYARMKQEG